MNLRKTLLLLALNFGLVSAAHADIVIEAPFALRGDLCPQVTGHWAGIGDAKEFGIIHCWYAGSADLASPAAGKLDINNLTLELINDSKHPSSSICPKEEKLNLSGECANSKIIIHTQDVAWLDGSLSQEGKTADVAGTVTFSVPILGKISPKVTMNLNKS